MLVNGIHYRTVWLSRSNPERVRIIDQRHLPFRFIEEELDSVEATARAISDMHVRGAGCIGATAGFGMYLAAIEARHHNDFTQSLQLAAETLRQTRPTAINLGWAVERQLEAMSKVNSIEAKIETALETAQRIADEDEAACRSIGKHGLAVIQAIAREKGGNPVNILTHCNAGWLAFVDHGSATAPIYAAHDTGVAVHVWVDETRPRNQGARLTAWELGQHGVPHTLVADNTGGHLMQHGLVDLVITGTDRTTHTGDVANKIGTYLKALAAKDNGLPFYVALPSSTFDWKTRDGLQGIPIEQRAPEEVTHLSGKLDGEERTVQLAPDHSPAANYSFDVTPARLITGLITERGICEASEASILEMFPEKKSVQNPKNG